MSSKSVQNFCTWLHSQNRWQRDSSYSTQNRQVGELTILQIFKYLLVGSILWRIRAWNHCNWVSMVVLKHFINIVFQTRPGECVFYFNVAVGGTSFWSKYSLTLKFPDLITSHTQKEHKLVLSWLFFTLVKNCLAARIMPLNSRKWMPGVLIYLVLNVSKLIKERLSSVIKSLMEIILFSVHIGFDNTLLFLLKL